VAFGAYINSLIDEYVVSVTIGGVR